MRNIPNRDDILADIKSAFPDYHIEIEKDDECPSFIAVTVYNVRDEDVDKVRSLINSVSWKYLKETKYCLMPMIVDRDNTEECYPEFLRYS